MCEEVLHEMVSDVFIIFIIIHILPIRGMSSCMGGHRALSLSYESLETGDASFLRVGSWWGRMLHIRSFISCII